MNNKGFMMAEVVVVSSIILIALVAFYTSYNKIISTYNQRIDYYDVTTLYELANIRDSISDYSSYSSMASVKNETYKKVYYLNNKDLSKLNVSNETFKDYLEYIDNSETFKTDNILVMERCINDDIDNCKYAYLEVFGAGTSGSTSSGSTSNSNLVSLHATRTTGVAEACVCYSYSSAEDCFTRYTCNNTTTVSGWGQLDPSQLFGYAYGVPENGYEMDMCTKDDPCLIGRFDEDGTIVVGGSNIRLTATAVVE